jgi:epoxyqueuosine reductase QueG
MNELSRKLKEEALNSGAALIGFCPSSAIPENSEQMDAILPGHRSLVVVAVAHSVGALDSKYIPVQQYDTAFTYGETDRIAHILSRVIQKGGEAAAAVPAYLPLDMGEGKMGMVGDVSWRNAAVESGIARWGQCSLAVTEEFGPRVRLGGVITTAELDYGEKMDKPFCSECDACIESCPSKALLGGGKINKKACGEAVFKTGLRSFVRFMRDLGNSASEEETKELVYSERGRDLWQALTSGNYYSCWECQRACPVGR